MPNIVAKPDFSDISIHELAVGVKSLGEIRAMLIRAKQFKSGRLTKADENSYVLACHAEELAKRVIAEFPDSKPEEIQQESLKENG